MFAISRNRVRWFRNHLWSEAAITSETPRIVSGTIRSSKLIKILVVLEILKISIVLKVLVEFFDEFRKFDEYSTLFIYEVSSIENSKESLENTGENTTKHDQISRDWYTMHCSMPLLHHLSYRGKGILRTVLQNTEAMCATFFLRRKRSVQETTLPVR